VPEKIRAAVRNQGGGHYNHTLFWQMMKKDGGGQPSGELLKGVEKRFGSFAIFKDELTKAALGQFGSGWAWLVFDANKQLGIEPTPNQDSPISQNKQPLLGSMFGSMPTTSSIKTAGQNTWRRSSKSLTGTS
jgi:Fe-Mn family superoxide dismutase